MGLHQRALGCPLRPGSIVVNHTIIVAVLVNTDTMEKIGNITKNVQEEIVQAATQQENCTDNSEPLPPRDRGGTPRDRVGALHNGVGALGTTLGLGLGGMVGVFQG